MQIERKGLSILNLAYKIVVAAAAVCMAVLSGSFAMNADEKEGLSFEMLPAALCGACTIILVLSLVTG